MAARAALRPRPVHIVGIAANTGSVELSGYAAFGADGTFTNSGTFTGDAGSVVTIHDKHGTVDSGTMNLGGTSTTLTDDRSLTVTGTGLFDLGSGTITAPKITVQGFLHTVGTVTGNVNVDGGSFGESFLHPPGTLTLDGNLKLDAASTLEAAFDAAPGGPSGEIDVSGRASLSGATLRLNITDTDSLTYGETFTVLTAGELKGKFGAIQEGNLFATGNELDLGDGHMLKIEYQKHAGTVEVAVVHSDAAAHPLDTLSIAPDGSIPIHDELSTATTIHTADAWF